MDKKIKDLYELWLAKASGDEDLIKELKTMDEDTIKDAFYKELEFGTAGLRGIIGAGTNRMNIYVVKKAAQGIANYVNKNYQGNKSIAIGYDSRIKSKLFAEISAMVFAANGIKTYVYSDIIPTPCVSYAIRYLSCVSGVMVTASHNPSKYNGYKVYGPSGCQISSKMSDDILAEIQKLDVFKDIKELDYQEGLEKKMIEPMPQEVFDSFMEEVNKLKIAKEEELDKNIKIVYTPLHGVGLKPVLKILRDNGYENIVVVKEQEQPDGTFPTTSYPNPESMQALDLARKYAKENEADIIIATDPDSDRVGLVAKDDKGEYITISGNQTGMLLLDYLARCRLEQNKMPKHPVCVRSVVTTDMIDRIAKKYGIEVRAVLTGFKYIGGEVNNLEEEGRTSDLILAFEESIGFLTGSHVRDKDAVNASLLIAEMAAFYKKKKMTLLDRLDEIYNELGYSLNNTYSYEFAGQQGMSKMNAIMEDFRKGIKEFGDYKVLEMIDYQKGVANLPKSNIVKFILDGGSSLIIRPSGTEPKIKVYLFLYGENRKEVSQKELRLMADIAKIIK